MRKLSSLFVVLFISLVLVMPNKAQAEVPVKAKAFMTIVGYGTAGGALLGAASMAFGTSTRAVAQGASLGLYAGILFGTYVLVSHHNKRYGSYDDNSSPYKESSDIYSDEYDSEGGGGQSDGGSGFFNRFESMNVKFQGKQKGGNIPPIHLNILQLQF